MSDNQLLTEDQAAEFLSIKPQTLAVWRMTGRNDLPYVKVGRAVRYRRADLIAWIDSRIVGKSKSQELQTA